MRKLLLALAVLLALGVALWPENEEKLAEKTETDAVSVSASAPQRGPAITAEQQKRLEEQQQDSQTTESASNVVMPRRYFPDAKIVSRVEVPGANGELRVLKTVETTMAEPFVVVEEVFQGTAKLENMIEQSAMVANQLLVAPVEGVTEERLVGAIQRAGAVDVKKSGENFLATFPALPDDPRAVETFKQRLIASADFELVIEPNYIRKLY